MISIDQNSHSLWDTLPKLQALTAAGHTVYHYIEDVDVAFTDLGADESGELHIMAEQFHPSGGSAWGAALFYTDFLGRQPTELRNYESQFGMKVAALAKQLDTSLDDLYATYSISDNHMLVGPSYVGDKRHHRLIGDLGAEEIRPFLQQIIDLGEADCRRRFPDADAHERIDAWFTAERRRVDALLADGGDLVGLYNRWLDAYLHTNAELHRTSRLFALDGDPHRRQLLELFTRDYDTAAGLYNQAMDEADLGLHPLHTGRGELPFFAVFHHDGHLVRTGANLDGRELRIAEMTFTLNHDGSLPVEAMMNAGVTAAFGKAALMVIQARYGASGRRLALPYHGSLYMPAAYRLEALLDQAGWLTEDVKPVCRVRLHLLDRLADVESTIALPAYLAAEMGCDTVPAKRLAAEYADIQQAAADRLDAFKDDTAREAWQAERFATEHAQIEKLQQTKREIAQENPKDPRVRDLWKHEREIHDKLLAETLKRIHADIQLSQLDFYDSRGAILPWCIALGGEALYNRIIEQAELYDETPENHHA